jgi:hypothetical protein
VAAGGEVDGCQTTGRLVFDERPMSPGTACLAAGSEVDRLGRDHTQKNAIRVLSLHYFCFAFACRLALYVEQVNERKLACVWYMEKLL